MRENRPKQIIECTRKIDAVYVNDDGSLWRSPVVVIALYDVVKVGEFEGDEGEVMEAGLIKYVSFSADGILDLEDCENLLGYEIDGDQQTWEREIKKYFDKIKRGQETRELHRQRVIELQKHCGDVVSGVFDRSYRERPACTEAKEEFKRLMGTVEKEG